MGVIIFNGVSSIEHGILVEHPPNYDTAEKDCEVIHVPGRNGDIVIDSNSYKNVPRVYNIAVGSTSRPYAVIANEITGWLHSASGYARLEDSYEPDYYRLAMYKEARSLSNTFGHAGRATINFDCKPQRFFKSGDTSVVVPTGQPIWNPTFFLALPIITVNGNGAGVLRIGSYTITISELDGYLTINSDIEDTYKGTVNKNSSITLTDSEYPKLVGGNNVISFTSGITSVSIVPKWWTL